MNAPGSALRTVRLQWPDSRTEQARLLPIGKAGGAGEIFAIESRPGLLAKIYHRALGPERLAKYERKLRWMLHHRPGLPPVAAGSAGIVQLAWPVALASDRGGFAGFVMEQVDFTRTLELDYLLTRRQAAGEGFEADFGKLATVCYNLAALLHGLHERGIAVVDLKPINLKVYKQELYVSILDCDGFAIASDGFVAEAPQVTPEYLAPEFQGRAIAQPEQQDRFALATIVFRLFNFGIHPYSGIAPLKSRVPAELAERIRLGLYPYGRQPGAPLRAAPASVHECFPDELRALFDRSFGAAPGARASALEWAEVLAPYARSASGALRACPIGHLQFAGKNCATCLREGIVHGHRERQRRLGTRLRATPARAVTYVRQTLRGTRSSPFQAALAQGAMTTLQLAPVTLPIRNVVAIEILWVIGLGIAYWWVR